MHPITLRFDSRWQETAFRADYERRSLGLVRAALTLGLGQYAAFGVLDRWVAPGAFEEVRLIRIVVCVVIAFGIGATFSTRLRRMFRPAAVVAVVGGLGVVMMEVVVQHMAHAGPATLQTQDGLLILDGYYYSGMMLILIYVHVLLRLRFVTASVIGFGLIGAYMAVASVHIAPLRLVNASLFLSTTQFSGMVASYALEWYARREFLHAREMERGHRVLGNALRDLSAAQHRLVRQEKLAGLGRLTSGIAHEIQNPLNFVVNFGALQADLADEIRQAVAAGDPDEIEAILADLEENAAKVLEHGRRAEAIVRRMQGHAGGTTGTRVPTDLNRLVQEAANRATDEPPCALSFDLGPEVGTLDLVPKSMGRVVEALVANACDAVCERRDHEADPAWVPAVRVQTRRTGDTVEVIVADNGAGVADSVRDRLFEPFVTTKPTGQGVGLSLSLARDVTEAHGGTLETEPTPGGGATFVLRLPASEIAPDPEEVDESVLTA